MATATRIAEVATEFLSIPLERPLVTAAFPIPAIDTALVRVRTDGGHEGVGWSFAFGRGRVAAVVRMVQDLAELIVGEDAELTGRNWQRMSNAVGFVGRRGVAALAMSALDTACWDIVGQAAGRPIHRLLGAHRDRVEAYASQGLWLDRTRDELVTEAAELVAAGFKAVKMRAGLSDEDEDVARVAAVREAIGPDIKLMVDANQAWTLKQTIRMADRLAPFDLLWLEEPMLHGLVDDYTAATARIPMPLCTGESQYFKDELLTLVQRRSTDYLMPDLMRMGGVTEWLKVAHVAEAYGLPVTPHLFMEHSASLAAACPNVVWQEYQPWWQPIMEKPVELVDGCIAVPDQPGFGIRLSQSAVDRFRI